MVIVLHAGDYRGGSYYDGLNTVPQDLAAAGFYVVIASYPLAPKNLIKGQYQHDNTVQGLASGRPPQQTRAVEAVVNAARADTHCYNGLVGILGGSAGGGHAAFVALDQTDTGSDWPFWNSLTRPSFVACFSGQYDFAERDDVDLGFIKNIENYTNTTTPMDQWLVSPIAHATSNIKPMYFIRSEDDPGSPALQQYYMWNALYHAGANLTGFRMWTIPNSDGHSFGYWNDRIYDSSPLSTENINFKVKERVIGFFKQYLPVP
jgi:acetyl esterase/lipase